VSGRPLEAHSDLARALFDDHTKEEGLARAQTALAPLAAHAQGGALALESLIGATVFTVCNFGQDLEDAQRALGQRNPPPLTVDRVYRGPALDAFLGTPVVPGTPGFDATGGIAHENLRAVVLGRIPSPHYVATTDQGQGWFERDATGALIEKSESAVPILLALPKTSRTEALPVVVFQHGLTGSRATAMALANSLAADGNAVLAIDLPFHGDRQSKPRDDRHNFTGAEAPDGLADSSTRAIVGFFNAVGDEDVQAFDTRALTDNFVQASVDLMSLSDFVQRGSLTSLSAADPSLEGVSFQSERMVLSSQSLGGFAAVLAMAVDENYGAAFLSVAGGGLATELLINSPSLGSVLTPLLENKLGVAPNEVLDSPPDSHPMYVVLDQLVARGDPLSYAARVRKRSAHIFLPIAVLDEVVPNPAQETLARALGLSWLRKLPGTADTPRSIPAEAFPPTSAPAEGNDNGRTAVIAAFENATHLLLTFNHGSLRWEEGHPFRRRPERIFLQNPVRATQNYLVEFARSYRATGIPAIRSAAP